MTLRAALCRLLVFCLLACELNAQLMRIATARVDGLEEPGDSASPRLEEIASALRLADADVVAIEGIPLRTQAASLASLLKPTAYQLAVYGAFTNGGASSTSLRTLAIYSKRQPFGARSAEWRATGQPPLSGGFAFAGFSAGTNAFCLYLADLPDDGLNAMDATADPQASRRRELAAQSLVQHVQWLNTTLSNYVTSFCVVGDFVTESRMNRLENAGRILQQAGFGAWLMPVPAQGGADLPFTALFGRGANLRATPVIVPQNAIKHPVCVFELNYGNLSRLTAAGAANPRSSARGPQALVIGIWAGVVVGVCGVTIFIWWLAHRSSPTPSVFRSESEDQLVLKVEDSEVTRSRDEKTEPLPSEAASWQARAIDAEQRVEETAAHVRAGLLQQLQTLVRDRFVAWLASQRGRLVASHQAGTEQVLVLDERLQRIQGHFEVQLRNRDQRIRELEQEIQDREARIRKLLLERANPPGQSPAGSG